MPHRLSTIDAAVEAIARGEVIIVMDDEDRENEGDFVCAAEKITPEIVNFMITHGRGQNLHADPSGGMRPAEARHDGGKQYGSLGNELYCSGRPRFFQDRNHRAGTREND